MIQYLKGQENPISRNPLKYNYQKLYEPQRNRLRS